MNGIYKCKFNIGSGTIVELGKRDTLECMATHSEQEAKLNILIRATVDDSMEYGLSQKDVDARCASLLDLGVDIADRRVQELMHDPNVDQDRLIDMCTTHKTVEIRRCARLMKVVQVAPIPVIKIGDLKPSMCLVNE
jgi:hypothetical protein